MNNWKYLKAYLKIHHHIWAFSQGSTEIRQWQINNDTQNYPIIKIKLVVVTFEQSAS